MDKFTAMILVVLVGIGVCMGVLFLEPDSEDTDLETFSIEYVTGDATGANPNPDTYVAGEPLSLKPMSYRDGLSDGEGMEAIFGGWYMDPGFNDLCMEIDPDTRGNLILYAKWQDNAVGRSINLQFNGTVHDGLLNSYTMSGNMIITYRYTDDEHAGYYMTYDTTTTYDHGFSQYTETNSTGGWNIGDGEIPEPIGYETIDTIYGEKNCTVFGGSNNRQWLGNDDSIIYRMVEESKGFFRSSSVEYNLVSSTIVEVVNEVNVSGYSDNGITVTGSGTYRPTDSVTLTASASPGVNFAGWYDSLGNLVSGNPSITFDAGWNDIEIYAMNDIHPDYTTETFTETSIELGTGFSDPEWTVYKYGTKNEVAKGETDIMRCTFEDTGLYEIYIEGDAGQHGYRTLEIAGDVVRTYAWSFDGRNYSITMTMDYGVVEDYRDKLPVDQRRALMDSSYRIDHGHIAQFVTYEDPYIQELANRLNGMSSGMKDLEKANFVLAFLQSIEYQSDEIYMGHEEYWKFPVETLYDMGGDCEDSSILYCSIVRAMGFDTALFLLPGHMMSGICIDGKVSGSSELCAENGKVYYYVETTNDTAKVGQKSPGINNPEIIVVP